MTMEELDFHMERKMTQWMQFFTKRDQPEKQLEIEEKLKDMKADQEIEKVEQKFEKLNLRKEEKQAYQAPEARELSKEEIARLSQYLNRGQLI